MHVKLLSIVFLSLVVPGILGAPIHEHHDRRDISLVERGVSGSTKYAYEYSSHV
jgi:hypothetical protein